MKKGGLIYCFYNKTGSSYFVQSDASLKLTDCCVVGVQNLGPEGYQKLTNVMTTGKFVHMVTLDGKKAPNKFCLRHASPSIP